MRNTNLNLASTQKLEATFFDSRDDIIICDTDFFFGESEPSFNDTNCSVVVRVTSEVNHT
jgi:hypothetical protein